jgi:hypothetical protein
MDDKRLMVWGLVALAALVAGGLVRVAVNRKRAWETRAARLAEWASLAGFHFSRDVVDATTLAPLPTLQLSSTVSRCDASNVLKGRRGGFDVTAFDLHHSTIDSDQARSPMVGGRTTWALVAIPDRELPYLSFAALSAARPDTLEGKMLGATQKLAGFAPAGVRGAAVPIDGRPGFVLRTEDAAGALRILSPSLLAFFEANLGWTLEAEGPWLLAGLLPRVRAKDWSTPEIDNLVSVVDCDRFVSRALEIARHFARA